MGKSEKSKEKKLNNLKEQKLVRAPVTVSLSQGAIRDSLELKLDNRLFDSRMSVKWQVMMCRGSLPGDIFSMTASQFWPWKMRSGSSSLCPGSTD